MSFVSLHDPVQVAKLPESQSFAVWCGKCGTYGLAIDVACVESFRRRHATCKSTAKWPRIGLSEVD